MGATMGHVVRVASIAVLASLMAGCADPDSRLAADQRSCEGMGHVQGTTAFRHCMTDLNTRRCARGGPRSGSTHVVTTECTRLN